MTRNPEALDAMITPAPALQQLYINDEHLFHEMWVVRGRA